MSNKIYSYEDVDIRGIDDKVYDSSLAAPGNTYPIADNLHNSFLGFGWGGSFNLETHFENPGGSFPRGTLSAEYTWKPTSILRLGTSLVRRIDNLVSRRGLKRSNWRLTVT